MSILAKVSGRSDLNRLEFSGKLKETKDGFVYVDVSDKFIKDLFDIIQPEGASLPPYKNKDYGSVGGHISVMYADEIKDNEIDEVKEVGQEIEYELGEFFSVEPEGWDEMERVWFLSVKSPQLEMIRENYGLSKKLNNHEFHITFAIKKRK